MTKRVALIGTGPTGIFTIKAMLPLINEGKVDFVVFEKQSTFGGLWNYSDDTGTDRWGEPVPQSMYRNLWTNTPRQCIEIVDLPQPKDLPSYVRRERITEWLQEYVKHFDLQKFIKFNTRVEHVDYNCTSKTFSVTSRNFGFEPVTQEFDYVLVASGHFSYPHDPHFEGIETFPGTVLHSKNYRDGSKFKGQRVLCIGGSFSAEDIATQCWKYGAAHTTVTCHNSRGHVWPKGMSEKPILTRIEGSKVHFSDGSAADYDVIIKCTGYEHHFPFMAEHLQLKTPNVLMPPLYKVTVFPANHQLLYLGMMNQIFAWPYSYAQGHFAAKLVAGDVPMPPLAEMMEDIKKEQDLEKQITSLEEGLDYQARHLNYMSEVCGLRNLDISWLFKEWIKSRAEGIMTFRDKSHASHFNMLQVCGLPNLDISWLFKEWIKSRAEGIMTFRDKSHASHFNMLQVCGLPNLDISWLFKEWIKSRAEGIMTFRDKSHASHFNMLQVCGLPNLDISWLFKEWIKSRAEGIMTFRDKSHASHFNMLQVCGLPNLDISWLFKEWIKSRAEGIMTFRDKSHASHFSGEVPPAPDHKWAELI